MLGEKSKRKKGIPFLHIVNRRTVLRSVPIVANIYNTQANIYYIDISI